MSILLDAGPALNFLAVGQENVLIQLAKSRDLDLATPQRVYDEVLGKTRDPRFSRTAVRRTWTTLKQSGRLTVLSDELTSQVFTAAVARTSGMPAEERVRSPKSLGEILVIAHASVLAQQGQDVFILIDDGDGRRRAANEQAWLTRQHHRGRLTVWTTPRVLQAAAQQNHWIRGEHTWEQVYDQMTAFDDGLPKRPK